jgi:probable F420-dependent oxidoreductase
MMSDPDWIAEFARTVEATEAESIWNYEHVALPDRFASNYPFDPSGTMSAAQLAEDRPDPLHWLQQVAARTSRVRIGTSVMVLPLHNPLVLAKRLATLDRLSRGRLIAGFGVGWLAEEYDALAVPFSQRGSRADEYLQIMRAVWAPGMATFAGRYHSFTNLHVNPKPMQSGGVPIVIGGHSRAAMRRAALFGDGVILLQQTADSLESLLEILHEEADAIGRPRGEIEVTVDAPRDRGTAEAYRNLGVNRFLLALPADDITAMGRELSGYLETLPL